MRFLEYLPIRIDPEAGRIDPEAGRIDPEAGRIDPRRSERV